MSTQEKEEAIKTSLTNFVDNRLKEFIPEVDKRISYFIDHDGNGNPDWEDLHQPSNMWAVYNG